MVTRCLSQTNVHVARNQKRYLKAINILVKNDNVFIGDINNNYNDFIIKTMIIIMILFMMI